MGLDSLSPVAPARVNVLLLPVGEVRRSRFLSFAARLQAVNVVRLGDISPDARGNSAFNPLAFPAGSILYNISTAYVDSSHLQFFPFDTTRDPVVVIAIADGGEWLQNGEQGGSDPGEPENESRIEALRGDMKTIGMDYHRALVHQLLVFDVGQPQKSTKEVIYVPSPRASTTTTVKTVMCDISALVLSEMASLAKDMQSLPTIESPRTTKVQKDQNGSWSTIDRVNQRMSMPVQVLARPNAQSEQSSRSSSRLAVNRAPSVASSATIEEATSSAIPQIGEGNASRPGSSAGSHDRSRERASVQNLSVMTPSERKKSRTKGRIHVVVGSLYLQAGRWPDALRELVDGSALARANNDYLWHARSLEYIMICLILFGWAGLDFQIPQICYPTAEKPGSSFKSSQQGPTVHNHTSSSPALSSGASRAASLQSLTSVLPDLFNTILNLYSRAANFTEESLPQLLYSESIIHFARVLAGVHLRDGLLDDELFRHIVLGQPLKPFFSSERPKGSITVRKSDISTLIFRAMPPLGGDLDETESVTILIGLTTVLSSIGLERKSAFILKELLSFLIPSLVQARKLGAAEMGIHPAAGLSTLIMLDSTSGDEAGAKGEMEKGLRTLLAYIGEVHGLPRPEHRQVPDRSEDGTMSLLYEDVLAATARRSALRTYGSPAMRVDILRSCINFSEALPDFKGVLQFTVELLHTVRRCFTMPLDHHIGAPSVSPEEQSRLLNNIKRTVGAAARLGMPDLRADYWDEFIVRNIEMLDQPAARKPLPHSKRDLDVVGASADTSKKSPFIYNPFGKTGAVGAEAILFVDELAQFRVTLQNPFEFDLEIDSIQLQSEGCKFEPQPVSFTLGPYCLQNLVLAGLPKSEGTLKVIGCLIKVRYCLERSFFIFKEPWSPKLNPKPKRIGLAASERSGERPVSTDSTSDQVQRKKLNAVEAQSLSIIVIGAQPLITARSTNSSQAALMVLEGETKSFEITVQNTSAKTAVDLLLFVFQDSATKQLQSAITNKDISPAELYDFEWQLANKPAMRWHPSTTEDAPPTIGPGSSATFTIDVLGKAGLLEGIVQIDYAHLGVPKTDVKERFYTRQILLPITMTVNAGVEMIRSDILPFSGEFAWANQQSQSQQATANGVLERPLSQARARTISQSSMKQSSKKEENRFVSLLSRLGLGSHGTEHCLLLLDLRNGWPYPLSVSIQVRETPSKSSSPGDAWQRAYTVHEILQPGHVSRLVLLLPRLYLDNPHAPIPSLSHARQYVVSATKSTSEAEMAIREAFWYREELLKHIRGTWKEESSDREGVIDLRRGIRLNPRMIDAIRIEDVDISLSINHPSRSASPSVSVSPGFKNASAQPVKQTGRARFSITTNTFLTLVVSVRNRTSSPILPLLRLQPSMRNQPHNIALDLSKRLAWTGMLQQAISPALEPGGTRVVTLGVTALCRGDFEIGASVEEIVIWKGPESERKEQIIASDILETKERRIWHARDACLIDARDKIVGTLEG